MVMMLMTVTIAMMTTIIFDGDAGNSARRPSTGLWCYSGHVSDKKTRGVFATGCKETNADVEQALSLVFDWRNLP